jgi:hypothetical protein
MFRLIRLYLGTLVRLLHARRSLLLENLALRHQQVLVLKRHRRRPSLSPRLRHIVVRLVTNTHPPSVPFNDELSRLWEQLLKDTPLEHGYLVNY